MNTNIQITDEELKAIEETYTFASKMSSLMFMLLMMAPKDAGIPITSKDMLEANVVMSECYKFVERVKERRKEEVLK
jgi:hypothetical protein